MPSQSKDKVSCSLCHEDKELVEFYIVKSNYNRFGRDYLCIECRKSRDKGYKKKKKNKIDNEFIYF